MVAPFTGVWIETLKPLLSFATNGVAPFTGVWIETAGLTKNKLQFLVAPFTGVWIETMWAALDVKAAAGRALHGRVD